MRIASVFTVPAEHLLVFGHFLDPITMRACIPGCQELERVDDAHYRGRLVNEIAHVRFNANFVAEVTELEPPRLVRAVLTGEDRRLGSSLRLNATLTVEPDGEQSQVRYEIDMALWGKLGRLGESIVRRRSIEVEREFATAFAAACTPPEGAATPATPGATPTLPPARHARASGTKEKLGIRNMVADALERVAKRLR